MPRHWKLDPRNSDKEKLLLETECDNQHIDKKEKIPLITESEHGRNVPVHPPAHANSPFRPPGPSHWLKPNS
jgi:hypothetical protein